jgi:hypothetical protein
MIKSTFIVLIALILNGCYSPSSKYVTRSEFDKHLKNSNKNKIGQLDSYTIVSMEINKDRTAFSGIGVIYDIVLASPEEGWQIVGKPKKYSDVYRMKFTAYDYQIKDLKIGDRLEINIFNNKEYN